MSFDPRRDLPTLADLSPPVADYPYFRGSAVGFEPEARDYSPANAWWLAEASFLAYGDADFLAARFADDSLLRREGLHFDLIAGGGDTAGFLMHNERFAIATFRGTRVPGLQDPLVFQVSLAPSLQDIVTDAQFPQTPFDHGRVHRGFALAFEAVAADLGEKLEALAAAGRPIWFSGHSLGGALATLAAARFGPGRFRGLYTYGCPRVGDAAFAALFDGQPSFRVVHHEDIVPRVPPPLLPALPPLRYAHSGRLVYIDKDGSVTPDADPGRVADIFEGRVDWAAFLEGVAGHLHDAANILTGRLPARPVDIPVPRGAVTDHAPIYYASFLKDQLAGRAG